MMSSTLLVRVHDKSLLGRNRGDPPRFEMLQTIRDYATERRKTSGEAQACAQRCAAHYIGLVNELNHRCGDTQHEAIRKNHPRED